MRRGRFDNPNDFDKMIRLKEFLLGGVESRKEVHGTLSLVAIQQRYGRMLHAAREASSAETGIIDVATEPGVDEQSDPPALEEPESMPDGIDHTGD